MKRKNKKKMRKHDKSRKNTRFLRDFLYFAKRGGAESKDFAVQKDLKLNGKCAGSACR